jgi:poly(beta-D-mannuronate) lyase
MRLRVALLAICVSAFAHSAAAEEGETEEACFDEVAPIVRLTLPSRYQDDSKTRSDIDEKANAAVNAALKPVDEFTTDLARFANRALVHATKDESEAAQADADCVLDRIESWAAGDALSGLDSVGARMAIPSRIGGIAFAYALARPLASDKAERAAMIDLWLRKRAEQAIAFFETEAPPRAAKNNLRAWAALALTRIGLTLDDPEFIAWGRNSATMIACSAAQDGSLPLEMERGRLALHYHLHATGPLVVTAALLQTEAPDIFGQCDNAIERIARFGVAALADPGLAVAHAGVEQSYGPDGEKVEAFELAWIVPFLAFQQDPSIAELGQTFEVLGNSKLGGDQSLLWGDGGALMPDETPAASE